MTSTSSPLVRLTDISKHFGDVVANHRVDFDLRSGEIHGLLGENGAGKTTLMNLLYGLYEPDEGTIEVQGANRHFESPNDAIDTGIGMVHQHFMQIPTFTVLDNLLLGRTNEHEPLLDRVGMRRKLNELTERYELTIDPHAKIQDLTIGDRQRVEILKALSRDVNILILDEPTSVLTPAEAEELFSYMEQFADEGFGVVFITHNLEEALAVTDRITVLRDGEVVDCVSTPETTKQELARAMVGRDMLFRIDPPEESTPVSQSLLKVDNLVVRDDRGNKAVEGVSLEVSSSSIFGLAGVVGNGQTELVRAILGLRSVEAGTVTYRGESLLDRNPGSILDRGIGHIPEELDEALVGNLTVQENLVLDRHHLPPFSHRGWLSLDSIREEARRLIETYDVRPPDPTAETAQLSGGNKQKLVVAREMARDPDLLVAAHPTRGVDIGAEETIRKLLLEARENGMGILLISTKLDEILTLSDRIGVIEGGSIRGVLPRSEADPDTIGLMMAGSE